MAGLCTDKINRCTATAPLWHAPLPDNYWLQIIRNTKHFRWRNVFDDMWRIGGWLFWFWFWFDVNRSTFEEDMRENDFFTFPFLETTVRKRDFFTFFDDCHVKKKRKTCLLASQFSEIRDLAFLIHANWRRGKSVSGWDFAAETWQRQVLLSTPQIL